MCYLPQNSLAYLPRKAPFLFYFFGTGTKAKGLNNWLKGMSKLNAVSTTCHTQGPDGSIYWKSRMCPPGVIMQVNGESLNVCLFYLHPLAVPAGPLHLARCPSAPAPPAVHPDHDGLLHRTVPRI